MLRKIVWKLIFTNAMKMCLDAEVSASVWSEPWSVRSQGRGWAGQGYSGAGTALTLTLTLALLNPHTLCLLKTASRR